MSLTIDEIARVMRVAHATVDHWINERSLPISSDSGSTTCESAALRDWLIKNNIPVPDELLSPNLRGDAPIPALTDVLNNGGIFRKLPGSDKQTALAAAAQLFPLPHKLPHHIFLQRLLKREALVSTGIGDGIAIPHPRDPLPQLDKPVMALFFLDKPVEYDALDRRPVTAMFMLANPTARIHLRMLSRLFYLLRKPEFRTLIRPEIPDTFIFSEARRLDRPA